MQDQLIDSDLPAGKIQSPANPTDPPMTPPRKLRGGLAKPGKVIQNNPDAGKLYGSLRRLVRGPTQADRNDK